MSASIGPAPQLDMYAALRQAIREDDERDAKAAALLKKRARALREKASCAAHVMPEAKDGEDRRTLQSHAMGAIMGEADWDAEVWLIDVELGSEEWEHLP